MRQWNSRLMRRETSAPFASNLQLLAFEMPIPVKTGRLRFSTEPITRIPTAAEAGQMRFSLDFRALSLPGFENAKNISHRFA